MDALLVLDASTPKGRRLTEVLAAGSVRVRAVARAGETAHALRTKPHDVVVFDPSFAGPDFAERMRIEHAANSVVAWLPTARSDETAELLLGGADEVLDATMGSAELLARLQKAVAAGARSSTSAVAVGDLLVDAAHGETRWRDVRLALTRRERQVLQALAETSGRTVRREVLYRRVWGYAMARGDRSVDVNVKRLRTKLARAGVEVEILTEPGVGYRLELPAVREPVTVP